jgi:hypothetical protein
MKSKVSIFFFFFSLTISAYCQIETFIIADTNRPKDLSPTYYIIRNQTAYFYCQDSSINRLDPKGKKNGKWIEYLNRNWNILKDSNTAVYFRFVYYDQGTKIVQEKYVRENSSVESLAYISQPKLPILLDSEYRWYDKQGRLLSDNLYRKGERVWTKTYLWDKANKDLTGKNVRQYVDYTKKYNDQPNTCYSEIYDKNGKAKIYYLRKGKDGWCFYEE